MRSEALGWLLRRTQRVHRLAGSVACLLLALWFASGIVMTFAEYPRHDEAERLAASRSLGMPANELPPALEALLRTSLLDDGSVLTLAQVENEPRWLFRNAAGERVALRALPPWPVTPLDEARARRVAEQTRAGRAVTVARLHDSDQWTVSGLARGGFPLFRVALADAARSELYVSAPTGEVLQESTATERLLAWLGPIPHWIYPAILRRERVAWRSTVLWLSALGLLVTATGLVSGVHVSLKLRRRTGRVGIKDPVLRLHQQLGLGFGLLASSWLFSGALSLTPFAWTGDGSREATLEARLYEPSQPAWIFARRTLEACQRELDVHELQFSRFGGRLLATCLDAAGQTRVVAQEPGPLLARPRLPAAWLEQAARAVARRTAFALTEHAAPDSYYYASHHGPELALPYARVELRDDAHTALYLDTRRPRLLTLHTARSRLERWLYHGLHSFDLPGLYEHEALWRSGVIAAMLLGLSLSLLGFVLFSRRHMTRTTRWFRARVARRGRPT